MAHRELALNQNLPVILVIEDDDAIQTILETALSDAGFEPAIAPSGEEAVIQAGASRARSAIRLRLSWGRASPRLGFHRTWRIRTIALGNPPQFELTGLAAWALRTSDSAGA